MYRFGLTLIAGTIAFAATVAEAGSHKTPPGQRDGNNWGQATSGAIAGGFPQGQHASDPSGDGHGPGTADEPRAGLPNVAPGAQGDLSATMDLLGL